MLEIHDQGYVINKHVTYAYKMKIKIQINISYKPNSINNKTLM